MHVRSIGTLVLAGVVALTAAGCGSSEEEAPAAAGGGGGGGCDDSDPLRIGHLAPLTGPSADLGALVEDGAQLAAEILNGEGGVLGRCVEILLKDDEGDPTKATQAARELVDQEEVSVVVGPVLSSPTAAALEVTTPACVPQMVVSSLHAASNPEDFPYSFMNEITQQQGAEGIAAYLERQGLQRPAMIAVNNALGTYYAEAVPQALEGTGIELVAPAALNETGAVDLTPLLRPLLEEDPDVLIAPQAAGPDNVAIVRARNQLAPDLPIVGIGAMANVAASGALSAEEMAGVVAGPFSKNLSYREGETQAIGENANAFLEAFREFRGVETLDVSAAQAASAYDQVMNAAAAMEGAGDSDCEAMKEWLETNPVEGVRTTYEWTSESHVGHPQEDAIFVVAPSLQDGILQIAPGEEE